MGFCIIGYVAVFGGIRLRAQRLGRRRRNANQSFAARPLADIHAASSLFRSD
jgi:hypothetical protein